MDNDDDEDKTRLYEIFRLQQIKNKFILFF
jgi:hypothetical protein